MTRIIAIALLVILPVVATATDAYTALKTRFAAAAQITLDVLITVDSDMFGTVDSADGVIYIAADGRYYARIIDDVYLFDGKCIWEYSAENNQVTKDCLDDDEYFKSKLSFIKNLDRHYEASTLRPDSLYILRRLNDEDSSLPDSLNLSLADKNLSRISYYDLNNDLNTVMIQSQQCDSVVTDSLYHITIPDSTEIIVVP
ncbi:MAG: hypothetical protein JW763_10775 [candidate division Zixibacteria bacterium]|nr:hypothetical protein [candidate division Zixibacteria bacterium]